jgi:hypothetical protein
MTPEEIQQQVNEQGRLTRADVQAILEFYDNPANAYVNMQSFLEGVTALSHDQKIMVLNDIESYV